MPTGILSDGVFDELGNRYVIPEYCFCKPKNLRMDENAASGSGKTDGGSSTKGNTTEVESIETNATTGDNSLPIVLRLSTSKDVKLNVAISDSVGDVKEKLLKAEPDLAGKRLRFIHLGKSLEDSQKIIQFANTPDIVIQVMVTG